MDFSRAQYKAVIAEIEAGIKTLQGKLTEVKPAAHAAANHWWVNPAFGAAMEKLADLSVEAGTAIAQWVIDVLKGASAPIWMFVDAYNWMNLRSTANGVSTDLSTQNLVIDDSDWSGDAREKYLASAGAQASAAARLGSIATTTSATLAGCAAAGLLFYISVAAVVAKLIAATTASIAAMGTGVFSMTGAALLLETAGFSSAVLTGATATLATFLTSQVTAVILLHGDAIDPGSFPGGVWPKSNTSQFSDATVKDDDADWSLKKKD
ncbi:hypothetical protein GCM10010168_16510 [Actinoplanes ianthinogenes]|uniref:Uncharacterized protein n=1 Tax=Actinoplanes ianthinogenes TaxID=122358 RepID=A0ABN6CJP5_9ACTN|nr:hypothetical protein [Actinoplanes ianthinogenes]BCJ44838.1 hypothetical protein Aiant_54950 [Actinoplanes ianthinogenes]GGR00293.1 hypothetical protein GCM10010168_16510 [Actinoplanes ianthinogenes]